MKRFAYIAVATMALTGAARPSHALELKETSEAPSNKVLTEVQMSLGISPKIARVSDASVYPPNALPDYVLIQDVHKHPEVQSHIAAAILHGYDHWGVRKVFLEGAVNTVDLTVFHRLPDETRNILLSRLINAGDLSGPEMAAVMMMEREWRNPPVSPFQLVGIENAKMYRDNLSAYYDVQANRERALYKLTEIRRLQASLQMDKNSLMMRQLDRTEALLKLKLSPAEYDEYCQSRIAIPSSPELDPTLQAAERFYRLVQLRSEVFLDQAQRKFPAGAGPRVLVVGGFHTLRMASYLRARGRTFVVLTPNITQGGSDELYERRLMETISALKLSEATPSSL